MQPLRHLLSLAILLHTPVHAAEQVDFVQDVQPILQAHCVKCHGPEEQNGGLRYDDKAAALSVADSGGRAIVPGSTKRSLLLHRITTTHAKEQMPPKGPRLSQQQVATLTQWISTGAAWPASHATPQTQQAAKSKHWSFLPITQPTPPSVKDATWSTHPIDHFLHAEREAAGLQPVQPAAPEALLRRLSYDLTGLPPSPQELLDFASQCSSTSLPTATARWVDIYLARSSYGERWGRHWMDWVRYADTAGDNSDYPIPQAYLYRNYIIQSLNQDVPYDRFLTEQLAGDLLPASSQAERNRLTIATGYLAMARRFGSLVERYPWHLTLEDSIDNMSRTMLGLTISCARCHDHKFDPISTRDYYGLYGILASTRYPFPGLELFKTQHHFVPLISQKEAAKTLRPYSAKISQLEATLQSLISKSEKKAVEFAAKEASCTEEQSRAMKSQLGEMLFQVRKAGETLSEALKKLPPLPTAYAVQDGAPQNARVQIKGEPVRLGAEVPRKFPDVLGGHTLSPSQQQSTSGRLQLAQWITSPQNPLTARVIVNRVWQRHFGTGLVRTTSDFGLRGEAPSHPALLDWLATEFIRSGWSLKHLHRLILTSRSWQLSSMDTQDNLSSDPENKRYWKHQRQRLDAESLRDTLLLLGGSLDLSPQTRPYPMPPSKDWGYTQHYPFRSSYPTQQRSVYQMVARLRANTYMQTFDGPDANVCTSTRDQSITPLQALFMVNDELLHQQAQHLAHRLLRSPAASTEPQRISQAFTLILCRAPSTEELQLLSQHLHSLRQQLAQSSTREQDAYASLTRSLLRLNEFLYLD